MKSKRSISSVSSVIASLGLTVLLSACAGMYPEQQSNVPPAPNLEDPAQKSVSLLRYCEDLRESGDLQLAAAMCRRAHELSPSDPEPLLHLAGILQSMGAQDSAAEAYRAVLLLDPQQVDALYGLGKVHIDNQRYDMARLQLEEALLVADGDPRIYNALGVIMDQRGDHAAAQDYYHRGLTRTPQSVSLRNNLGLSLVLNGDPESGLALLQEVAAEPAAGPATSRNLAMAYEMAALPASSASQTVALPAPVSEVEVAEPPAEAQVSPAPRSQTTDPIELVADDRGAARQTADVVVAEMPAEPAPIVATPSAVVIPESETDFDREFAALAAATSELNAEIETETAFAGESTTEPVRLLDEPASPAAWGSTNSDPAGRAYDFHPPADSSTVAAVESGPMPHHLRTAASAIPAAPANAESAEPAVAAAAVQPTETPIQTRRDAPMTLARAGDTEPAPREIDEEIVRYSATETRNADLPIETAGATASPVAEEWIHSVQLSSVPSPESARQSWQEINEVAAEVLTGIDAVILRADLGEGMGIVYRVRTNAMEYRQAAALCERLKTRGLDCFSVKASRQSTDDATVERICATGSTADDCGGALRNTALPSPQRTAG